MFEFDFNLKHALEGLAEVNFYLSEYRQRVLDYKYAEFLGNLSELMYNIDKREEAVDVIKEGRLIAWYKLRD